jgi:hypothetical protein
MEEYKKNTFEALSIIGYPKMLMKTAEAVKMLRQQRRTVKNIKP